MTEKGYRWTPRTSRWTPRTSMTPYLGYYQEPQKYRWVQHTPATAINHDKLSCKRKCKICGMTYIYCHECRAVTDKICSHIN